MELKRIKVYISAERIAMLAADKIVFMTQNGQPYEVIPQHECCTIMKEMRQSKAGRVWIEKGMKECPFCLKPMMEIEVKNGNGHRDRGNGTRGKRRVYDTITKKYKFVWEKEIKLTDVPHKGDAVPGPHGHETASPVLT
jgi:hypothetical protein